MASRLKVHSLTGRITPKLMREAFKAVKRNRGAAGVDQVSIEMYEANLDSNLDALMRRLKRRGQYRAKPLRRVHIPKGKGKVRPLGIPAVGDRVAQEVIRRLLEPIWEPAFSERSHGFRPGRSCHTAIEQVLELFQQGRRFVVDADIKGFFDNIPHELIIDLVAARVADGNILGIVRQFLTSGVMEEGKLRDTVRGTPQGGVISPLLANIVLDVLDQRLTAAGYEHVRYADDFVILCKSPNEAERALDFVRDVIGAELELELSAEKTHLTSFAKGFDFLGFHLTSHGARMRKKSVERFKDKVRAITVRHHNLDDRLIDTLNRVIKGTANYFATRWSTVARQFTELDKWVRLRIRCMRRKRKSSYDHIRLTRAWCRRQGLASLHSLRTAVARDGRPPSRAR